MNNHRLLALALLLWCLLPAKAQTAVSPLEAFLADIEAHNPQLLASHDANQAILAERRADNRPGQTSVEYSPFYQGGYQGMASSELIVQQEFDFPTLYAARNRSNTAMQQVLDAQYRTLRRDILLQAVGTLYDLCEARQTRSLYARRLAASDSLLLAYQRRLAQGDATLLDVNRIRMDQIAVRTEALRCESRIQELVRELVHLNGNHPLSSDIAQAADPLVLTAGTIIANDAVATYHANPSQEVQLADAALQLSKHELSEARQSWLPQLTMGYRRNTERDESLNGFIVGVSLPLFSNKGKVKAAQLRNQAADYELLEAMTADEMRTQTLQSQSQQLRLILEAYDEPLMQQQLALLSKAVLAGELTVADFYTEADRVYTLLLERYRTHNEYLKLLAQIHRDVL